MKFDCVSLGNKNGLRPIFKAIPPGAQLTPLLRICLHLFRHTSQISSAEKSLLPPQFVLPDEKSGGATAQQALCGIAYIFCAGCCVKQQARYLPGQDTGKMPNRVFLTVFSLDYYEFKWSKLRISSTKPDFVGQSNCPLNPEKSDGASVLS